VADTERISTIAHNPAGWAVTNDVHVWPRKDLIEHEIAEGCFCIPTPERLMARDGTPSWLWTHHSLDGRESVEPLVAAEAQRATP
jgi:hypothetical protein